MRAKFQRLYPSLNYTFTNPHHIKHALTHCSMGEVNNERLEFLGDSILNHVIAYTLYEKFPQHTEGQLSRMRASLVKGETLADIAHAIHLGDFLILGQGELKSGGFRRASILADTLEAIFGAVYLDGGFYAVQQVICHVYRDYLASDTLTTHISDYKTELQEYLQAKKMPLPEYILLRVTGEEHEQSFYVACNVPTMNIIKEASGKSRRKAEQEAAKYLLEAINTRVK